MVIKNAIRKTLEVIAVTLPLWGPVGAITIPALIERNHYNSLSREQRIEYLQDKLNTTYKDEVPPTALMLGPRGGAVTLALYSSAKSNIKKELAKLKFFP